MVERRKVMSLGRSSLVVSLPRGWVKLSGVKKGDEVSLDVQRDRSLILFLGDRREKNRKITLYIGPDETTDSISRNIIACYLNGYSSIRLASRKIFSTMQRKAIRRVAEVLYMRIMESDAKNMKIETLIEESKASIVSSVRRMHLIASSMCRDACNLLRDQNLALARAVFSLDDDVDHFCFFLLRLVRSATIDSVLAKQLGLDPIDCLDYQILVYRIEHVADHAANIAKQIILLEENHRIPDALRNSLFASCAEAVGYYDKAVNHFFSKDISGCNDVLGKRKEIEKLDREIASKSFMILEGKAITICAVCSIRDSIRQIAEWAAAIAESTVLRSYGEKMQSV